MGLLDCAADKIQSITTLFDKQKRKQINSQDLISFQDILSKPAPG